MSVQDLWQLSRQAANMVTVDSSSIFALYDTATVRRNSNSTAAASALKLSRCIRIATHGQSAPAPQATPNDERRKPLSTKAKQCIGLAGEKALVSLPSLEPSGKLAEQRVVPFPTGSEAEKKEAMVALPTMA